MLSRLVGGGKLKRVTSRGEQIALHLPDDWVVEPEGNGRMFYSRRKGSGTLRLDVISIEMPSTESKSWVDTRATERRVEVEDVDSGARLVTYKVSVDEDGVQTSTTFWFLEMNRPPYKFVSMFTFTVDAVHEHEAANVADLAMLEREIRVAELLDTP